MYSVDEIIEQIDEESDIEDNLDNSGENVNNSQEDGDAAEGTENSTKIKPKVKRTLGARPKLDAERLKGPRGLICMESLFSELKFRGRGYEKQDLNEVMKKLQYWCHRLFPKFTFDDCLAQLERLGAKKPVITLKRKILFDMIDDLVTNNPDVIDDDVTESQQEALNDFDMLLNQEPSTSSFTTQPAVTAEVIQLTEEQKEMIAKNRQVAEERRRARLEAVKEKQNIIQSSQASPTNSQPLNLTEDQKLIIEKNRLLAVEKRRQLQNKSNVQRSEINLLQSSSLNMSQKSNSEETEDSQETSERPNQENLNQKDNESIIMDVDIPQETNCESEILVQDSHKLD